MKNTIFLAIAAFFITASVNAQSTVDSIAAKYKLLPMPEALTVEKTFPVLGTYQLANSTDSSATVSVSLDSSNKGIIWVEGLPVGRVKAYLKQSPATYRILAQKSATGKQVPEGTLIFSPETGQLNVSLGAAFNDAEPAAIFAMNNAVTPADNTVEVKTKTKTSKTKSKVTFYSANKVQTQTATNNATFQQALDQQKQDQQ